MQMNVGAVDNLLDMIKTGCDASRLEYQTEQHGKCHQSCDAAGPDCGHPHQADVQGK
jgi:hypothetical protein